MLVLVLVLADPGRGGAPGTGRRAALRYAALAVGLLVAGYGMLWGLTGLGLALLPAKVLTEVLLFATSYQVQRRVVFRPGVLGGAPVPGDGEGPTARASTVPTGTPAPVGSVAASGRSVVEHEVPRARPRG